MCRFDDPLPNCLCYTLFSRALYYFHEFAPINNFKEVIFTDFCYGQYKCNEGFIYLVCSTKFLKYKSLENFQLYSIVSVYAHTVMVPYWQYLTVNRLVSAEDEDMVAALNAEALRMSLQYNFVTELTSLIVVQEGMGADNFTIGEQDGISGLEEVDVLGPSGGGGNTFNRSSGQILRVPRVLIAIVAALCIF